MSVTIIEEVAGQYGTAYKVLADTGVKDHEATVVTWMLHVPDFVPVWEWYQLALISLEDIEGVKPAHKAVEGVDHEVFLVTLHPEPLIDGKPVEFSLEDWRTWQPMTPMTWRKQTMDAPREWLVETVDKMAWAVVEGHLPPESMAMFHAGSTVVPVERQGFKQAWDHSFAATLAHQHDPHHGAAN